MTTLLAMNRVKNILYLSQRGYNASKKYKNVHPKRVINPSKSNYVKPKFLSEKKLYESAGEMGDNNEDEGDCPADYDIGDAEPDFSKAHIAYDEYNRELRSKKELEKMRMVASKYFKSDDPNFITWTERQEIKSLHDKDPVEWTCERLSKSFPALPEVIKKLIKSPYMPRTAKHVMRYDQKVAENWERFKKGHLAVSDKLKTHLARFQNRKIQLVDLESLAEKFVKPKPTFPVPRNSLFTDMVKSYVEQRDEAEKMEKLQLNDGENNLNDTRLNRIEKNKVNFNPTTILEVNTKNNELIFSNSNFTINTDVQDNSYAAFDDKVEKLQLGDGKNHLNNTKLNRIEKNKVNLIPTTRPKINTESNELIPRKSNSSTHNANTHDNNYATFDVFLEKKISGINFENQTTEDEVLIEEYKKIKNANAIIDSQSLTSTLKESDMPKTSDETQVSESESQTNFKHWPSSDLKRFDAEECIDKNEYKNNAIGNYKNTKLPVRYTESDSVAETETDVKIVNIPENKIEAIQNSSETGIVEWKKKINVAAEDYPKYIKVPWKKARTGVSFKVNDCYYDSDGEFLYRTPGLCLKSSVS